VRRISFVFMSTLAAVVLLFGYRTSTANPASTATTSIAAGSPGTTSSTGSISAAAPVPQSSSSPSSSSSTASTKTVTGQTVQTRWGPVQVQLIVAGSKVTAVNVLQAPSGNSRDVQINNSAVPVLKQETLQAQGAGIDSVSGATYTSQGYITSLQSALDQAAL